MGGASHRSRRRLWSTIAALALCLTLPSIAAASGVGGFLDWEVKSLGSAAQPTGCLLGYGPLHQAGQSIVLAFILAPAGNRLMLSETDTTQPEPSYLTLSAGGLAPAQARVFKVMKDDGLVSYVVDLNALPDVGEWVRTFRRGGELSISHGGPPVRFSMAHFGRAYDRLDRCGAQAVSAGAKLAGLGSAGLPWVTAEAPALAGSSRSMELRPPPRIALSSKAVRGVEPVEAADVARAVTDFLKVHDDNGMIGAIDRSETCFTAFERAPSWKKADACLAFDEAASQVDEAVSGHLSVEPNEYFSRKVLEARTADVMRRLGGDHYVQDAHLKTLRMAAKGALAGALEAEEKVAGAAKKDAQPSRHAELKGRFPDTDAADTDGDGGDEDDAQLTGLALGLQVFLTTWNTKDFDAVEAVSRACYSKLEEHPGWHDAEPCFSLDEAAWNMADGKHRFYKAPMPAYFTRDAVNRRQTAVAQRTAEMQGQGKEYKVGLQLLRDTVLKMLKDAGVAADKESGEG
jgi:hypothetical protein